jgi:hypothetical protein
MIANKILFGLILTAASLAQAIAIPLTYDIGTGSSVTANTSSDGLQIRTELVSGLSSQLFTLNDGQSYTFNFFRIWTDERTVDYDDKALRTITARLDFDVPDINAQVQGVTLSGIYMGCSGGGVLWNDPVTVAIGTRVFTVNLSNAYFDLGYNGALGDSPATITATIKQISSGGTRVPEAGSTALLLGLGFGATLMLRRRFSN